MIFFFFFIHQRLYRGPYQPPTGSNLTLRKPIAICDFPGGSGSPVPSLDLPIIIGFLLADREMQSEDVWQFILKIIGRLSILM